MKNRKQIAEHCNMHASEARALASEVRNGFRMELMPDIDGIIEKAARKGEFECETMRLPYVVIDEIVHLYRVDGYRVRENAEKSSLVIDWSSDIVNGCM